MTPRHQDAMGMRERRTQGVSVAALRARLRTHYRAAKRGVAAEVSFSSSLPGKMKPCGKIDGRPMRTRRSRLRRETSASASRVASCVS